MTTFPIHTTENNSESQQHLEENKQHFSNQCLKVLELLRQGKRLTTVNAPSYGILSLPRRIKDIKDQGIHIDEHWLYDEKGKKTIKEWFLSPNTEQQQKEFPYRKGEMTAADYAGKLIKATQTNLF